ncbi:MAG TPA: class I SAM-dependent methyltransferase, partial [Chloroflexota bacterium]
MQARSRTARSVDFTRLAQQFERVMVTAVFQPWAADLIESVGVVAGSRVLDVACGTGIVARLAAPRVGPGGRVAGLDLNEAMIAVAQSQAPPNGPIIEWRQGDAVRLPYADGAFDVVLCQQGLQYMSEPVPALEEMKRVVVRGGRVGLSVFAQSIGYELLERTIAHVVGAAAARAMQEP